MDNKSNINLDGVIPMAMAIPVPSAPEPYNAFTSTRPSMNQTVAQPSFKIPPSSANLMSTHGNLDNNQINQLRAQGYSSGMVTSIGKNNDTFALRFWVVDNSGSMAATDGSQLIVSKNKTMRIASCTRWKEIQETVDYHVQMAGLVKAPTVFRLLNNPGARVGPQEFGIADKGAEMIQNDMQVAKTTMMNATPTGVTPLSMHINDIREQIVILKNQLQFEGRRVAIVLATDGLPSDDYGVSGDQSRNEFINAMRTLEGLPVWIVVRLCTNDEDVVEFYNDLDAQLELSIEVLDDYCGEAEEVFKKNPWVNYTLPLHRIREMGFENRLFDLLDERPLTRGELRDFCVLIFGSDKFDGVPESESNFRDFMSAIEKMLKSEQYQWNPVKKQLLPLIDLKKMNKIYGDQSSNCALM